MDEENVNGLGLVVVGGEHLLSLDPDRRIPAAEIRACSVGQQKPPDSSCLAVEINYDFGSCAPLRIMAQCAIQCGFSFASPDLGSEGLLMERLSDEIYMMFLKQERNLLTPRFY
jgi:hypothetical protein